MMEVLLLTGPTLNKIEQQAVIHFLTIRKYCECCDCYHLVEEPYWIEPIE